MSNQRPQFQKQTIQWQNMLCVALYYCLFQSVFTEIGTVVVVIVWYLDLQLPMQSIPITTKVVSYNPTQAGCTRYNII